MGDFERAAALVERPATADYLKEVWAEAGCERLPSGLNAMILDTALAQGSGRARMTLQRALGVPADGEIGPRTLLALRGCDPAATVREVRRLRETHYRAQSTFPEVGPFWMRRLAEVEAQALAWAGAAAVRDA